MRTVGFAATHPILALGIFLGSIEPTQPTFAAETLTCPSLFESLEQNRARSEKLIAATVAASAAAHLGSLVATSTPERKPFRTKEQLIADAQLALFEDSANGYHLPRLGEFVLNAEWLNKTKMDKELVELSLSKHYEDLKKYKNQYTGNIEEARFRLIKDHLSEYCRDKHDLTDLYTDQCGNCVAETLLTLSYFLDANVKAPAGTILGVQEFKDHLQPVFYDPSKNIVYEIISGEEVEGVKGPIYKPAIIFHAFLKAQGIQPKVSELQLLIRDEDEKSKKDNRHGYDFHLDQGQTFNFPGRSNKLWNKEPPPEHASILYREMGAKDPKIMEFRTHYSNDQLSGMAVSVSPQDQKLMKENFLPFRGYFDPKADEDRFQFADTWATENWKKGNKEEKTNLLVSLKKQMITQISKQDSFQDLLTVLENPKKLSALPEKQIQAATENLRALHRMQDNAFYTEYTSGKSDHDFSHPVEVRLEQLRQSFSTEMGRDTKAKLLWLDSLAREKKYAALDLLRALDQYNRLLSGKKRPPIHYSDNLQYQSKVAIHEIWKLAADPQKVSVRTSLPQESQKQSFSVSVTLVPAENIGPQSSPSHQEKIDKDAPAILSTSAPIQIGADTLVGIAVAYRSAYYSGPNDFVHERPKAWHHAKEQMMLRLTPEVLDYAVEKNPSKEFIRFLRQFELFRDYVYSPEMKQKVRHYSYSQIRAVPKRPLQEPIDKELIGFGFALPDGSGKFDVLPKHIAKPLKKLLDKIYGMDFTFTIEPAPFPEKEFKEPSRN